jgi:hypothetical protein
MKASTDPYGSKQEKDTGMSQDYVAPALTDEQKNLAGMLLDTFGNLCLVSGLYQGKPVAYVCAADQQAKDVACVPLFIVLTENMKDDCLDASGRPLSKETA